MINNYHNEIYLQNQQNLDMNQNLQMKDSQKFEISSITSENNESDFDKGKINEKVLNSLSDENLEILIKNNDVSLLEEYVNNHFSNLTQEEMIEKLMALDENFREKLLTLIMEYQKKISNPSQSENIDDNNYNEISNVPAGNTQNQFNEEIGNENVNADANQIIKPDTENNVDDFNNLNENKINNFGKKIFFYLIF